MIARITLESALIRKFSMFYVFDLFDTQYLYLVILLSSNRSKLNYTDILIPIGRRLPFYVFRDRKHKAISYALYLFKRENLDV